MHSSARPTFTLAMATGCSAGTWLPRTTAQSAWIEVVFDTPLYIKDVLVYETYKPGSIYIVASAESHNDDNTAYCNEGGVGGEDAVACSTDTEWTALYSGTAAPLSGRGRAHLRAQPLPLRV